MRSKLVFASLLLTFGVGMIIAIRIGYVSSAGMRMTIGLLAVWALGGVLKIVIESRKKH